MNEDTVETSSASDGGRPPEEGQRYIRLDLKSPDPDVKEMADQAAANYQAMNDRLGLLMWGLKVFGHEERTTYDPARWRLRLQEARRDVDADGTREGNSLGRGGPGIVAAVCIRDHWEEMPSDEQEWCVNEICSEVERDGDNWNQLARIQLGGMEGDRASAWVLPLLIREPLSAASASRVRQTLVIALTHAINEVRSCAAAGIGEHLWEIDREFTLRCVNALATETRLLQAAVEEERNRLQEAGDFTKLYSGHWRDRVEANIASVVRRRFFEADGISSNAYQNLDSTHWYGAETNKRILAILGKAPTESAATAAFEQLAHTLVGWWDADNDRRRERRERNFETEQVLTQLLENFLLRTSAATVILQPILNAVERHPREVTSILEGLIGVEDRQPNTPQFWALWSLFADKVRGATWLARIDAEHSSGSEMLSAIFLGSWWKDEVRHWRSLEGHAEHIHTLFQELPASSTVLDDYVRFLYHVGEQSLPNAFISIVNRLLQGEPQQMLRKGNTVFMLEVLLQRYVYGRPLELKRQTDLRNAVLTLLDVLVENGSSASFRMRDDFVTPLPIQ